MASGSQIVHVGLSTQSYDIHVGAGLIGRAGHLIGQACATRHALLITDENVQRPHAEAVAGGLADGATRVDVLVVPAGEASKSVDVVDSLWNQALRLGADRGSVIVAVGGGVVGDLAGFVAAGFARGIRFVQIPTTLLAQVDSSVGGKVGVNLPQAKNMVGAFWQPAVVLIDTDTLETLPQREYRAGLAEVVKYGVIMDAEFFALLQQNIDAINRRDQDVLTEVIARCCRIKADVVQQDERETSGVRARLNYGHTFAHALEVVAGYGELLHGEAVSIGMMWAARLAERLGRTDARLTNQQRELLLAFGLPVEAPALDATALVEAMRHDKKAQDGRLRFILPSRLGHVELVDGVPDAELIATMRIE